MCIPVLYFEDEMKSIEMFSGITSIHRIHTPKIRVPLFLVHHEKMKESQKNQDRCIA